MEQTDLFANIIKPDFDLSGMEFDTMVNLAVTATEGRELYQKVLGKIAHTLFSRNGEKKITEFADAVENASGRRVPVETLRVYRWVYQRLEPVVDRIPDDFSYTVWKSLASTDDPGKWLDMAVKDGLSGPQLNREIRLAKGQGKQRHVIVCPHCGKEFAT